VNVDYHVEIDHHYYSVPHTLVPLRQPVDVRVSALTVEIFSRGQRVAAHSRSHARGQHTTDPAHMPKAHQQHREWSPSRLIAWAATVGAQTAALVEAILASRPHPEQGYRSCLGILRLARREGATRLEAACARALAAGARSYRHVEAILKHGLDRLPLAEAGEAPTARPVVHDQLRGPTYYQ
jgi:transposase